ncbi:MAG: hypothetical protein ABSG43_15720 [Solirubrobacteraceae bacterium]
MQSSGGFGWRGGLEHEHLDGILAFGAGAAQEGSDGAGGESLDGRDQLRLHRAGKRVALDAPEFGAARGDEVRLGVRRAVLEQAHDDVLVEERSRAGRAAAGEVSDQLADLVRERCVQRSPCQPVP